MRWIMRWIMKRSAVYTMTLVIAASAAVIVGCASQREEPPANLVPHDLAEIRRVRAASQQHGTIGRAAQRTAHPVVAVVLGGGGLRGFAHVGVLRALEELGVRADIIVGTSAGAVVGAAYASGLTPDQIESAARDIKVSSLIDFTVSTKGLMRGDHLAEWMDDVTSGVPVEQFPRRFAAVATDLESGQAVLLDAGSAGRVVQASAAVPGINVPVSYDGGHLIDGGATSLVPVHFARAMGADIVIAVDIYCRSPRPGGTGATTVIGNVMRTQSCLLAESEVAQADLLIAPEIVVPSMSSKEAQALVIRAGYEAAYAVMDDCRHAAKRLAVCR